MKHTSSVFACGVISYKADEVDIGVGVRIGIEGCKAESDVNETQMVQLNQRVDMAGVGRTLMS